VSARDGLQLGAVFPTTEIGTDPVAIRDWAQAAESLGYDHIIVYDHVLGAVRDDRDPPLLGPYGERDAFLEPFVLLAWLAAATTRIELCTGVLILPQRQTALVAKQAVELDLLSGGRLRLGVGTGWNHVEYTSLGVPFEDRGRRFDEQVALLRALWSEPVVDFDGAFHRVDRAGLLPLPGRPIPIWFGGFTPVALRRAARIGDGFLFGARPSQMRGLLGMLHEELARQGRADTPFGTDAVVDFSAPHDSWAGELETWREAGGTHVSLRAMDTAAEFVGARHVGYCGPSDYIDALETFRREIG
jgi:probable F420-dependent oxidoreductase